MQSEYYKHKLPQAGADRQIEHCLVLVLFVYLFIAFLMHSSKKKQQLKKTTLKLVPQVYHMANMIHFLLSKCTMSSFAMIAKFSDSKKYKVKALLAALQRKQRQGLWTGLQKIWRRGIRKSKMKLIALRVNNLWKNCGRNHMSNSFRSMTLMRANEANLEWNRSAAKMASGKLSASSKEPESSRAPRKSKKFIKEEVPEWLPEQIKLIKQENEELKVMALSKQVRQSLMKMQRFDRFIFPLQSDRILKAPVEAEMKRLQKLKNQYKDMRGKYYDNQITITCLYNHVKLIFEINRELNQMEGLKTKNINLSKQIFDFNMEKKRQQSNASNSPQKKSEEIALTLSSQDVRLLDQVSSTLQKKEYSKAKKQLAALIRVNSSKDKKWVGVFDCIQKFIDSHLQLQEEFKLAQEANNRAKASLKLIQKHLNNNKMEELKKVNIKQHEWSEISTLIETITQTYERQSKNTSDTKKMQQKLIESENKIKQQLKELQTLKIEINQVKAQKKALDKKTDKKIQENAELKNIKNQKEQLVKERDGLRKSLQEEMKKCKNLQKESGQTKKEIQTTGALREERDNLRKSMEQLKQQKNHLQNSLEAAKKQSSTIKMQSKDNTQKNREINQKIKELNQVNIMVQQQKKDIKEKNQTIVQLQNQMKKYEADNNALLEEIRAFPIDGTQEEQNRYIQGLRRRHPKSQSIAILEKLGRGGGQALQKQITKIIEVIRQPRWWTNKTVFRMPKSQYSALFEPLHQELYRIYAQASFLQEKIGTYEQSHQDNQKKSSQLLSFDKEIIGIQNYFKNVERKLTRLSIIDRKTIQTIITDECKNITQLKPIVESVKSLLDAVITKNQQQHILQKNKDKKQSETKDQQIDRLKASLASKETNISSLEEQVKEMFEYKRQKQVISAKFTKPKQHDRQHEQQLQHEITHLNKENKQLKQQTTYLKNQSQEACKKVEQLNRQKVNLEYKLNELQKQSESIQIQFTDCKSSLQKSQDLLLNYRKNELELESSNRYNQFTIKNLKVNYAHAEQQLKLIEERVNQILLEKQNLQREKQQIQKQHNREIQELRKARQISSDSLILIQRQRIELNSSLERTTIKVNQLQSELEGSRKQMLRKQQEQQKFYEKKTNQLQQERKSLLKQVSSLQEELLAARSMCNTIGSNQDKGWQLKQLKQQKELQAYVDKLTQNYNQLLINSNQQKKILREDIERARNEQYNINYKKIQQQRKTIRELKDENYKLSEVIAANESSYNTIVHQNEVYQQKTIELESYVSRLLGEIQRKKGEASDLQQKERELQAKYRAINDKNSQRQWEIQQKQRQIESKQREIEEQFQQKYRQRNEELNSKQRQLEQKEMKERYTLNEIQEKERQLQQKSIQIEQRQRKIQQKERYISEVDDRENQQSIGNRNLNGKLESTLMEIGELKAKVTQLDRMLQDAEAKINKMTMDAELRAGEIKRLEKQNSQLAAKESYSGRNNQKSMQLLQREYDSMRVKYGAEQKLHQSLQKEYESLKEYNANMKNEQLELKIQLKETIKQMQVLKTMQQLETNNNSRTINDYLQRIDKLQQTLKTTELLKEEKNALQKQLLKANTEFKYQTEMYKQSKQKNTELEALLRDNNKPFVDNESSRKINILQTALKQKEEECGSVKLAKLAQQLQFKYLQAEYNSLQSRIEQYRQIQNQYNRLKQETKYLSNKLDEELTRNRQFEQRVNQLEENMRGAKQETKKLRQQCEDRERENIQLVRQVELKSYSLKVLQDKEYRSEEREENHWLRQILQKLEDGSQYNQISELQLLMRIAQGVDELLRQNEELEGRLFICESTAHSAELLPTAFLPSAQTFLVNLFNQLADHHILAYPDPFPELEADSLEEFFLCLHNLLLGIFESACNPLKDNNDRYAYVLEDIRCLLTSYMNGDKDALKELRRCLQIA